MKRHLCALGGAAFMLGVSMIAVQSAQMESGTQPPDPPKFSAQGKADFVSIDDILTYKALPQYHEPAWVTKQFVDAGKLPPVKDRLPKEPMVYKAGNMPDGIGDYGGTLRHVIGGRPQGWNWVAGQSQGWGGISMGLQECLTRTGPLFEVKASDLHPMPNLAKSWDWSKDGHTLTMHLIEGAKWSDGVPFTSKDVMFYWQNILDPNVSPLNGASRATFGGKGTTLKALDDYTIQWHFQDAFPKQFLYVMAYGTFCPGPAHMLEKYYPKNSDHTYDQYQNAYPPKYMNFPTMGAWVPVEYRPDDIIVMRRNPYYWKVDSKGNQLPYLDEVEYKLSTWQDRDVQAVAGTGDFSNLEQAESFVEALKRSAKPDAPARLEFGPRIIGYTMYPNMSDNAWGNPDARGKAVRKLNRNVHFRKAITEAIDRERLGQSLVKGPFTAIYPGGLYSGTSFYDKASTVYYPYDLKSAKAELAAAGLKDTDGDGIVNFPPDMDGGKNVEITILVNSSYQTDKSLAEGVVGMLQQIGIRAILNEVPSNQRDSLELGGQFDWEIFRNNSPWITVVQNTSELAPVGPRTYRWHRAAGDNTKLDLLPFEQDLVDTINKFIKSGDNAERVKLMKHYQNVFTKNVYGVGLTQYPGALIINKRFANIPPGAPIYMYNWAEDNIMRERVYVPTAKQQNYELFPDTLPGKPGSAGPVKD